MAAASRSSVEAAIAVPRDMLALSLEALEGPAFQFMSTGSGLPPLRWHELNARALKVLLDQGVPCGTPGLR